MAPSDAAHTASEAPARPPLTSHQSNSLPSTPYQHARNLSFHSRSPSPRHGNTSPRSTHSETTHLPPSLRKPFAGCKYETAMAFFRRRMPYTIGTDLLPEEKEGLKGKLEPEEEQRLTNDIMEVYDRLLPSAESDDRRRQLVRKLEKLFNDQWPGHNIKVNVFGSSGNKLCSSDSDVDICITTTYKELEHVCLLAEVLARHGMERVVCISHAKVPIVKIWDPELRLACDMNVNNTLALENTRMVRTYVEIDERVRPLAMIIKYWTKRRILNDAGLGGTLSSYTWICLIVNFLQTRDPPILPSLQARPHKKRTTADGLMCSFDDDLNALADFGKKNRQSLGELLFQFFRYYAHDLNYEKHVISVREGKLVSKEAKGWHLLQNNRLCVEEPFNTSRNLGNTADDTSFRGVHIELRRAFKFIAEGNLTGSCEQYEYPPEEERTWERPPPQPRPVLSAPPNPSRGGRGGGRGGRNTNQYGRGGHTGRRTSNTPNKANSFRNNNGMSASELSLQAQHAQYLLHDHLYQQIQILQAQEQELRLQLQSQALVTGRSPPVLIRQPFIQFPLPQQQPQSSQSPTQQQQQPAQQQESSSPPTSSSGDENSRSRSSTINNQNGASVRPQYGYYNPAYYPVAVAGMPATTTSPPSPSTAAAMSELRRNPRRSSVVNGSPGASLRAQSQPARSMNNTTLPSFAPLYAVSQPMDGSQTSKPRQGSGGSQEGSSSQGEEENHAFTSSSLPNGVRSTYMDETRPTEYMGYYLATSPQLQAYQHGMLSSLSAAPVGLALQNGGFIPIVNPQEYMAAMSASQDAFAGSSDAQSTSTNKTATPQPPPSQRSTPRAATSADRGPLIVDGSVPPSEPRPVYPIEHIDPYASSSQYTSNSDDPNTDTPASSSDTFSQDYQDNSSVDIDHTPSWYSRPADAQKPAQSGESLVNGHSSGKPGLLSTRLQNLHHSNTEKVTEAPSKSGKTAHAHHPAATKDTSNHRQPASTEKGQSGSGSATTGTESTSTSHHKRRPNGVDASEKVNGVNHKSKPKGRHDASHHHSSADKERHHDHHGSRKTNGVNATHDSNHSNGGWQTSSKKKKQKNARSNTAGAHHGGEPLPADESMRKGG
ncbi:hypothetical protein SI65_09081 [Aspergillus cristatus]|uniref:polynucleotide adenylyltransferase n=1 Tax=Aspergillus cristatus TaxID=573508 RepID=A0A1E3B3L3_ASPCR|nr:hypothetical protein SI65_09081 [Aspergillus cristatus]